MPPAPRPSPFATGPAVGSVADAIRLAASHQQAARYSEAAAVCRAVLANRPGEAAAVHLLGLALARLGHADEGLRLLRQSVELRPGEADFHHNLGAALAERGQTRLAVPSLRAAVARRPGERRFHASLGKALVAIGWVGEAEGELVAALADDNNGRALSSPSAAVDAWAHLAVARERLGDAPGALAAWRRAVALRPDDPRLHSNLIFCLNHVDGVSQDEIFCETIAWAERFWPAEKSPLTPTLSPGVPGARGKKRRIAYISDKLREHPGARFLAPVVQAHDRSRVEVWFYADVPRPDEATRWFQSQADGWRDVSRMDDAAVANLIRADGIDVLIETTGHMAGGGRLGVMARRPAAELHVTWPGYPGTTGLPQVDLCLTDALRDPPGAERHFAERRLVRVAAGTSQAYDAVGPWEAGRVAPPAPRKARDGQPIRFGALNRSAKVSDTAIALWSAALREAEGSTLLLLVDGAVEEDARIATRWRDRFARHGVAAADRLRLTGRRERADYLKLFDEIDVAPRRLPLPRPHDHPRRPLGRRAYGLPPRPHPPGPRGVRRGGGAHRHVRTGFPLDRMRCNSRPAARPVTAPRRTRLRRRNRGFVEANPRTTSVNEGRETHVSPADRRNLTAKTAYPFQQKRLVWLVFAI